MTGSDIIEKWIGEQQAKGIDNKDIKGSFVYGDTYYELTPSRKKGKFDLKATLGCINLNEYEKQLVECV